jgi:hypothetical protein
MPPTLSEELIEQVAPDASALQAGRGVKKQMSQLGVSADGTWLLGACQGSAKAPYQVSVDLINPSAPVGRCTCPSRKFPCKHALGLMFSYLDRPEKFATREPAADLLAKRDKQAQRAEKTKDREAAPAGPRKVNLAAQAKKAKAQREGLDLLQKLLTDLVSGGQWFEKSRLTRLENQSKQMSDHYLPGAMVGLRRLALAGRDTEASEEQRVALGSELIGRLWAMVQKGRGYLDNKLAGDEGQGEADAVMEEVLGKAWQLTELREKGYFREGLTFVELAWERWDDAARQERIEMSHLVELGEGRVYQAIAYRPFKAMGRGTIGQASYQQPLQVKEAAVYPGFANRRVRWDPSAESAQSSSAGVLKKVHGFAASEFEPVLAELRKQLKHPLAPRETTVLLRCQKVGRVGECVVIEDTKGVRIEAADRHVGDHNRANLVRAAGELRKQPALLARLFVRPLTGTIVAQPLTLLSPEKPLRLGI